jgi:hypothetical protein
MTYNVPVGLKSAFHSNPEDALNHSITPSSPVLWTAVPPTGVVSLLPAGLQTEDCWITGVALGTATVTISQGGVSRTDTVNVVPVPLDHFALIQDPPVPA